MNKKKDSHSVLQNDTFFFMLKKAWEKQRLTAKKKESTNIERMNVDSSSFL